MVSPELKSIPRVIRNQLFRDTIRYIRDTDNRTCIEIADALSKCASGRHFLRKTESMSLLIFTTMVVRSLLDLAVEKKFVNEMTVNGHLAGYSMFCLSPTGGEYLKRVESRRRVLSAILAKKKIGE